ncbi:MAG: thiamine pyrophosphate-binding protein, partial [Burkholderiaceae bacterium]|nr:thiamine pyrophosphate-binding protein [Burkholderiaceae bacterium]
DKNITVAQALAQAIALAGVKRIFGLPGGRSCLDVIDATAQQGIDFILTKTESAAVMMAGAVAETSGVIGVALMTKGPGLANGVNGVAYASLDRAPVLVITEGMAPKQLSFVTHQVYDQRAVLTPLVKGHSRLVGSDVIQEIAGLIEVACTPPFGPVHIELTSEVAQRIVNKLPDEKSSQLIAVHKKTQVIDLSTLASRKPVVVLGLEARQHSTAVRKFIEMLGCPVLPTYKAKGVVPDQDSQVVCLFTGGSQEAECIAQSDLMIMIGLDPVELVAQAWPYGKPAIEIAASEHPKHYVNPEISMIGPISEILLSIETSLRQVSNSWTQDEMKVMRDDARDRLSYRKGSQGLAPDFVVQQTAQACAIRGLKPRMAVDAGAHMFSAAAFFPSHQAGDTLISNGLGSMAFALPAAIGASLDDLSQPVICFIGDGGLMMCLGELCTAIELNARVVIIVFNDSALSLIDIKQQSRHFEPIGVRWEPHNFA